MANISRIAPDFDLFSVDAYQWDYTQPTIGAAEAAEIKALYLTTILPKMAAHQQIMLVPGTFGCSNQSVVGRAAPLLTAQSDNVVAKLQGLFEWAKTEPRVGGFVPWHWANRTGNGGSFAHCDMNLGAEAMPAVVAKLAEIGRFIINQTSMKSDDAASHSLTALQ
jgi:hypothetical protein